MSKAKKQEANQQPEGELSSPGTHNSESIMETASQGKENSMELEPEKPALKKEGEHKQEKVVKADKKTKKIEEQLESSNVNPLNEETKLENSTEKKGKAPASKQEETKASGKSGKKVNPSETKSATSGKQEVLEDLETSKSDVLGENDPKTPSHFESAESKIADVIPSDVDKIADEPEIVLDIDGDVLSDDVAEIVLEVAPKKKKSSKKPVVKVPAAPRQKPVKKEAYEPIVPDLDESILEFGNRKRIYLKLKYSFDCDERDLFLALTKTPYMQNWLAEKVDFDEKTGIYTFHWRFYSESAKISEKVQNRYLKWDWVDAERGPRDFIAFSIHAIPGDDYVDMYIYDICEEDETETMKQGWDKLMNRLQLLLG